MLNIYYSKLTGEIYTISKTDNKQDFRAFGQFADDMAQILNIIYAQDNDNLFYNKHLYKVENGAIILKSTENPVVMIDNEAEV